MHTGNVFSSFAGLLLFAFANPETRAMTPSVHEWVSVAISTDSGITVDIKLDAKQEKIVEFIVGSGDSVSPVDPAWYRDIDFPLLRTMQILGGCSVWVDENEEIVEDCSEVIKFEIDGSRGNSSLQAVVYYVYSGKIGLRSLEYIDSKGNEASRWLDIDDPEVKK